MTDIADILVLHGPNLNLLGQREHEHYGHQSLEALNQQLQNLIQQSKYTLCTEQSNSESKLIELIHKHHNQKAHTPHQGFLIFNPAAFTHTSIALRDALLATELPFIEVHLSNIHAREPYRHNSYFSDIALGTITGLGVSGYELALASAIDFLNTPSTGPINPKR